MTVSECTFDLREGGAYRIVLMDDDGLCFPVFGVVHDVDAPRHVALSVDLSEHPAGVIEQFRPVGSGFEHVSLVWRYDVRFAHHLDTTTVEVVTTYPLLRDRDHMIEVGGDVGWAQSFVKLDALLRELTTT